MTDRNSIALLIDGPGCVKDGIGTARLLFLGKEMFMKDESKLRQFFFLPAKEFR
jgi:hypothetical protein